MEELTAFIERIVLLEDSAKEQLRHICTLEEAQKGDVLVSHHAYCKHLYFITKGIVKLRFITDGNEFIMRFFDERILFTDIQSWTDKKSVYEIIAIENLEYLSVPLEQFEQLCLKHRSLETFYRKLMTRASINMMNRIQEMLEKDATSRYDHFVKNYPQLLQRISLGDLSKYLGITQVSLSRIRAGK